jgi:hypothetical protein
MDTQSESGLRSNWSGVSSYSEESGASLTASQVVYVVMKMIRDFTYVILTKVFPEFLVNT